jgi:hypothetical protein
LGVGAGLAPRGDANDGQATLSGCPPGPPLIADTLPPIDAGSVTLERGTHASVIAHGSRVFRGQPVIRATLSTVACVVWFSVW